MKFENYKLGDFLMDESFYNWVVNPNCEDGKFWEAWLVDHPEAMSDAEKAKKALKSISFKDRGFSKQEISELWEKIKSESMIEASPSTAIRKINYWKYFRVAAVILPFVVAAVMFLFFRETPKEYQIAKQIRIEKSNPRGEKRTVFLPDGSRVKLNAESKISFLKPFDKKFRRIHLEGEAFFEVIPDKNRPFIVTSGELETKVLGTSFNIKAYPEEQLIEVAVQSGLVSVVNNSQKSVMDHKKSILLSPMEMVTYSESLKKASVSDFDPLKVLSWKDGTLYFENASMHEFISRLERWYGVEFVVERDKPIVKGITGTFTKESLSDILEGTHDTSEFEYEFLSNGTILIK